MYEIEVSNWDDQNEVWVTEKVHESDQNSMRRVKACTFSRGVSMIQAADFQLLATNPAYNLFHEHTTLVKIRNVKTGKIAFDGFVAKVYNDGMDASGVVQKSVSCDGCLSYLNETIQMYRKFDHVTLSEALFDNRQGYTTGLIVEHNANVAPEKRIYIGSISISATVSFECKYESTLECIKKNILDAVPNAEIRITRNAQGQLLLHIDDGSQATTKTTPVQLADNMVSMALETDASHIVTRLVPLGAYIETTNSSGKKVRTNQRVDISTARTWTDTDVPSMNHQQGNAYIDDTAAQALYGIITGTATFDDQTDPEQLMYNGADYLKLNNRIKKSYKAEVLDLSTIGLASDELEEGYVYRFYNEMIPINEDLRIQKITVDIFNAHKPTIEIGYKTEKITDVGAKQAKLIEYDLPEQRAEFLDTAMAAATASIVNATQGQVFIEEGDPSVNPPVPGEILIMDNPSKASATKVWRWNLGGFGYSPNGYNGPYINAMTIDGTAVHDFVMAGSVEAQNITITGGRVDIHSSSETSDVIHLSYSGNSTQGHYFEGYTKVGDWVFTAGEITTNNRIEMQWDAIRGYYAVNDRSFTIDSETGNFFTIGGICLENQNNRSDVAWITKSWKTGVDNSLNGYGQILNEHTQQISQLWAAVFPS